jgi:hypothetical protein
VAPTGTVEITQGGQATGDFEATATFDSFRGTAPGGAAGLVISTPGSGDAYAFIRQTDTPQLEVMVAGMGTAMVPASEVGGTLRVARHAGMMTATATAGTSTVELVGAFPAGNLTMAAKLGIYNRSETDNPGETSIRFTDFAITGSTDLLSDAFDCDSVP